MSPATLQGDTINDLPAVANAATELPGGLWEVEVLAGPVAGAYVNKKLTTEQLAAYLAGTRPISGDIPGPNLRPDMLKQVRFFLAADRDASPDGGDCFEELDTTLCATGTVVLVQFYRTDQAQPFRYDVKLVAVYDSAAAAFVNRSGSFLTTPGSLVPARFVPSDSADAAYGYVRRDTTPGTISDWREGELSIWSIGGNDQFATAKQSGGPFPAFTGVEDDYWKPAAAPSGSGTGGPTLDLLDLTTDFIQAVIALSYTDCEAAPGDSPAGSYPGQWFDAYVTFGGTRRKARFTCGRQSYDPAAPAGTTGVGPCWKYFYLLG